jgi:NADH dehydrogenase [ubiquinone] 1 alpha subcomplex assembly factor 7
VSPDASFLAARLAKQIEASGPISVYEYMREANTAYYGKGDPFGADGDFITAPEISQMFGELVGLWLTDMWMRSGQSAPVNLVELGPGRGTLMADMLRAAAKFGFDPAVHFVETSETLRAAQMHNVPHAVHHDSVESLPKQGPLLIIANEFFDALPVRQFVATHSGWRERVVVRDRGGGFAAMPGTRPVDHLIPTDVRNAPNDSMYETAPDMSEILFALSRRMADQGGAMLIIDYGYTKPGLGSTLQAVAGHSFADPFENPGEQDLTAHVNFPEIVNLAMMQELRVSGPVEQGRWLQGLGIDMRAQQLAQQSPERADEIKAMRDRLVEPSEMGELFKVVALSSADWPEPEGFFIQPD